MRLADEEMNRPDAVYTAATMQNVDTHRSDATTRGFIVETDNNVLSMA
jgi:hypothetical protein